MHTGRRQFLTTMLAGSAAVTGLYSPLKAADAKSVKIGYVVSKTGANAAGAQTTTIPNYELWVADVQQAGGLKLPDGSMLPVEIVAYDDRSQTEEVVRGIERLARQDKVDFILPPWGTGFNLAVAPLMARFGYPQLAGTSVVPKADNIAKKWPNAFWLLGSAESYAKSLVGVLAPGIENKSLNGKVAMIAIADGFGIDLSSAARAAFADAGVELVMDKTYPLGTQDFNTLISEASASGADIFVAYSYPGDTFAITKQAQLSSYNPKVFHTGVGSSFAIYPEINGGNIEGVISLGGIDGNSDAIKQYIDRHTKFVGKAPDSWASPVVYASLQMLAQAIERRGLDKAGVSAELASGTFDTILGTISLEDNQLKDLWFTGQWQNGRFVGISPTKKAGAAAAIIPKPVWK